MKTINVEDALKQRPFRPFVLHMTSGKDITVGHPEALSFSPSKRSAVVWEGEHYHIIDVMHVSSISVRKGK